jgi:hypothetical protein
MTSQHRKGNQAVNRLRISMLLILMTWTALSWGSELPSNYPEKFANSGTIDSIHYTERTVIVNDLLYYLADKVIIHTPTQDPTTIFALRKGLKIGFGYFESGKRLYITEAWVLPSSYNPPDQ